MSDLFEWTVPPMELVARGTLIYLGLVLCFRYLLRRDIGSMSTPDLLFVVLIADAAQNAMAGEYKSVGDGAVLLATLIFWNIALDWLAYRSETFRRFIGPPPLPLIRNGRWIRANLKQQWITTEEVEARLREHGIESVSEVRAAFLEPNGELGVIKRTGNDSDDPGRRPPGARG